MQNWTLAEIASVVSSLDRGGERPCPEPQHLQQIEKGELVSGGGVMDEGFLKDRVERAASVVALSDTDSKGQASAGSAQAAASRPGGRKVVRRR